MTPFLDASTLEPYCRTAICWQLSCVHSAAEYTGPLYFCHFQLLKAYALLGPWLNWSLETSTSRPNQQVAWL
jgi:hypothetical protein